MIPFFDITTGIVSLWDDWLLESKFNQYWTSTERDQHNALLDSEAGPDQPWPYCCFELMPATVEGRSSGGSGFPPVGPNRQFQYSITLRLHIFTKTQDSSTAKQMASLLGGECVKVFGGHPTEQYKPIPLTYGGVLAQQLQSMAGMVEGDEEYKTTLAYKIDFDAPVAD